VEQEEAGAGGGDGDGVPVDDGGDAFLDDCGQRVRAYCGEVEGGEAHPRFPAGRWCSDVCLLGLGAC